MSIRRSSTIAFAVAAGLVLSSAAAQAQQTPHKTRWEVEGYGGFAFGRIPASGSTSFPDPGAPITSSNPTLPSRQTPSWFFGDGASMLNEVLGELELPDRLTPLDTAIASPGFNAGGKGAFGFRVRRAVMRGMSVEFSLDFLTGSPVLSDAFLNSVESSRASFETSLAALLSSGPFTGVTASATSTVNQGTAHDVALSGSLNVPFGHLGAFRPYLTVGGGMLSGQGSPPSVELDGTYQGTLPGNIVIHERDQVVLSYSRGASFVAVMGAGLRRDFSSRWGLRVDGRVLLGPNGTHALIDATPSVTTSTPAGFVETFTYPSIQFSNNASTGRVSSLGPPEVQGFAVFSGTGVQLRTMVTVGVFVKF
jgi:hypothetical protein